MRRPRLANRDIPSAVAWRDDFVTHNQTVHGEQLGSSELATPLGVLPAEWREQLDADAPEYVVWSYSTPVAWLGKRGYVVPDVVYSVTTARHQGYVLRGWRGHTVITQLDGSTGRWRGRRAA